MTVKKIGDWDKIAAELNAMPQKYQQAKALALQRVGIYLVRQVKKGIESQAPGGKSFRPLHPYTIDRKESSKALIADSDLIGSVDHEVEKNAVFVGLLRTTTNKKKQSLENLGWIHEYGCLIQVTERMRNYLHSQGLHLNPATKVIKIPARPFLGPVADAEEDNAIKIAIETIVQALGL